MGRVACVALAAATFSASHHSLGGIFPACSSQQLWRRGKTPEPSAESHTLLITLHTCADRSTFTAQKCTVYKCAHQCWFRQLFLESLFSLSLQRSMAGQQECFRSLRVSSTKQKVGGLIPSSSNLHSCPSVHGQGTEARLTPAVQTVCEWCLIDKALGEELLYECV